jgi:hypothetical protein
MRRGLVAGLLAAVVLSGPAGCGSRDVSDVPQKLPAQRFPMEKPKDKPKQK